MFLILKHVAFMNEANKDAQLNIINNIGLTFGVEVITAITADGATAFLIPETLKNMEMVEEIDLFLEPLLPRGV